MSRRLDQELRCDAPGCTASVVVRPSGRPMPEGWWWSDRSLRGIHACPEHAPAATAAEKDVHGWEVKQVRAMNDWRKENPPPEVADWLQDIIP